VSNGKQNPYVFIVGCPRSGTTLLQRVVNAHPSIAMVPESHWTLSLLWEGKGLTSEGFVIPDQVSTLLESSKFRHLQNKFRRLGIHRSDLEALALSPTPLPYATFVAHVFNLYGSAQGKTLVGQKTPSFARRIRALHALWPTARFIHLIRDGRSVCLSALDWKRKTASFREHLPTWSEDPVSTAALWWESHVREARGAGKSLGPDLYYEVRYESLVANAREECEALSRFLAVPYDEEMLRFHEGRMKSEPGLDAKHSWLPVTPGLRNWANQMSAEDIERFEAAAGDLLEELSYPLTVHRLRPEAIGHATNIRNHFTERRRSPKPLNGRKPLRLSTTLRRLERENRNGQ
jgi:hypothetical protein